MGVHNYRSMVNYGTSYCPSFLFFFLHDPARGTASPPTKTHQQCHAVRDFCHCLVSYCVLCPVAVLDEARWQLSNSPQMIGLSNHTTASKLPGKDFCRVGTVVALNPIFFSFFSFWGGRLADRRNLYTGCDVDRFFFGHHNHNRIIIVATKTPCLCIRLLKGGGGGEQNAPRK